MPGAAPGWYGVRPASPAAKYGNRARAGPMRKPANQPLVTGKTETPPERHFLLSTADDLAATRAVAALEVLLAEAPWIAATLPPDFADGARRFVALLMAANRRLNLTRVTAPEEVARLHLLDSLAALPILDAMAGDGVLDLGSGGGLPAVPLALARPGMRFTLADSAAKKAAVLVEFTAELGLRNVDVVSARGETLGHDPRHRERYLTVTARACAALPVLVELALPLLAIGGSLVAWKGPLSQEDDEMRRGGIAADRLGGGTAHIVDPGLPALGGHRFVVVAKERATPSQFPRRPGVPGKRPLG